MEEKKLDKKKHKDHENLAGEHPLGDKGQFILFIIFLAVWISDSFIFHYSDFITQYIPIFLRILIGAIILAFSAYLISASHKLLFDANSEEPMVVRKGAYGLVRHPIYLSSILLYLGLFCFTLSISTAIILIITLWFYHFIASYEEKLLLEKFGEAYHGYQSEVPMWLPWTK